MIYFTFQEEPQNLLTTVGINPTKQRVGIECHHFSEVIFINAISDCIRFRGGHIILLTRIELTTKRTGLTF